jgi:hypothetical protein
MLDEDPLDDTHEYELVTSDSPISVDGYALGEPKRIKCWFCDADVYLTPEKTPGVWSLNHEPTCPNTDESVNKR